MTYFVRTRGNPAVIIQAVQREVWAIEPLQAFYRTATMGELFSRTLEPRRFTTLPLSVFAGMALVMAAVGIFSVISFYVGSRTHELGAQWHSALPAVKLMRFMVARGLGLALGGMVLGLIGAWGTTRAISSLLFGVTPSDTPTLFASGGVIVAVGFLASYLPARRVTRVDPAVALRYE